MKTTLRIIGLMSGTSLDGLDIADCEFVFEEYWKYKIHKAITVPYPLILEEKLRIAPGLSALQMAFLHNELGDWIGSQINDFTLNGCQYDAIVSHGQTIFHQPDKGLTLQIGNPANIHAKTGLKTIADLRSVDVALGGQGAPLVPVGDMLLFKDYEHCINLGGIANISTKNGNNISAFDICGCNLLLNRLANELNLPYDKDGKIASEGKLNHDLFNALNQNPYFSLSIPKSLGVENLNAFEFPLINESNIPVKDKMTTITHHIAYQISKHIKSSPLITGGGSWNKTLVSCIEKYGKLKVVLPSAELINYKEALIFAFLGALKLSNQHNCLSEVTGSQRNHIGGCTYG